MRTGHALLDVNVLVALAWPNHIHHHAARAWFTEAHQRGWATCSVTETGFVRVSSNRRVLTEAVTPSAAVQVLGEYRALPGHTFWPDDVSACDSDVPHSAIRGYRQVTDAHLLGLAIRREGLLVTFDAAVRELMPEAPVQLLTLG